MNLNILGRGITRYKRRLRVRKSAIEYRHLYHDKNADNEQSYNVAKRATKRAMSEAKG